MLAEIYIDTNRCISPISPLLFSGFAEHMGRCIYEGIYDPQSPHADGDGFRKDVLEALRELNLRAIRYPGGNFLSGYNWRDGIDQLDFSASWNATDQLTIVGSITNLTGEPLINSSVNGIAWQVRESDRRWGLGLRYTFD